MGKKKWKVFITKRGFCKRTIKKFETKKEAKEFKRNHFKEYKSYYLHIDKIK